MTSGSGGLGIKCKVCGAVFYQDNNYQNHMKRHGEQYMTKSTKNDKTIHTHTDTYPISCQNTLPDQTSSERGILS